MCHPSNINSFVLIFIFCSFLFTSPVVLFLKVCFSNLTLALSSHLLLLYIIGPLYFILLATACLFYFYNIITSSSQTYINSYSSLSHYSAISLTHIYTNLSTTVYIFRARIPGTPCLLLSLRNLWVYLNVDLALNPCLFF